MDRTGTLTFGCPGCLCCVYTAEPCSWDPSSVRLCSHSKKLTPCELRSEKLTLPTRLSGGLDTVEVVQLQGHWFPSRLDIIRPSPRLAPFDESCAYHLGSSWWQGLAGTQHFASACWLEGCFPFRAPIKRHPRGNPGDHACLVSRISNL